MNRNGLISKSIELFRNSTIFTNYELSIAEIHVNETMSVNCLIAIQLIQTINHCQAMLQMKV